MAYKWFCGLSLTEKAPDATTLSVNRKRRFRDNDIPEQIFNEILRQAMEKGLVGGTILYTDSTHIKAKANKHKKTTVVVERTPKAYLEELDEAIDRDRKELGKKPFDKKDDDDPPPTREVSKSDPESGQLHKEGKPDGFHIQRAPDRGQQAQHCGKCADHSGQCQRRRTRSRDTQGY